MATATLQTRTMRVVCALACLASLSMHDSAAEPASTLSRARDGAFVTLYGARSVPTPAAGNDAERARQFLMQHARDFSGADSPLELVTTRVARHQSGQRNVVRLRQQYQGIDINGAEAVVHIDPDGVRRVVSTLVSGLNRLDVAPTVSINQAEALAATGAAYVSGVPRLELVDLARLRGHGISAWQLAWRVNVAGAGIDDTVWIDARHGAVLYRYTRVAHAFFSYITDNNGTCPSNPPQVGYDEAADYSTATPPVSDAFSYLHAAYSYFLGVLGHDGLHDAAGVARTTNAVVGECADLFPASVSGTREAASWDRAAFTMRFGAGMAHADDIVGHEYGHAVIDDEARFALTGQSGALAEAFADIFGELVDLRQATGNDDGDARWAIGEDAPGGPFRDMSSPARYQQPEKIGDADRYYCGFDADIAIHTNSSVLTHAFALLVDGGSYNGVTVTAVSIDTAARIFYRALTDHLTSSATFSEAYQALLNAADDLIMERVITPAEKMQLLHALNAVELNATPCHAQLPYCATGHTPVMTFYDGFENINSGNWVNTVATGINHWNAGAGTPPIYYVTAVDPKPADFYDPQRVTVARRGQYGLWADGARDSTDVARRLGDSSVVMLNPLVLPRESPAFLQFESQFRFQVWEAPGMPVAGPEPDGAVIEYSTDRNIWLDAGAFITAGQGYTGTIQSDLANPLAGRNAFVGATHGYVSTQLDLSSLAGQTVYFRFRVGTDKTGGDIGWFIDDVAVYSCTASQLVVNPLVGLETSEGGGQATFTLALAAPPSAPVTVTLASSNPAEGKVEPTLVVFDETDWNVPRTITISGVDDGHRDGTQGFTVTATVTQASEVGFLSSAAVSVSVANLDNETSEARASGGGDWGVFGLLVLLSGACWLRRRPCRGQR